MSSAMILLLVGSMAVWLSAAGRPEVVAARLFEFRESFLEEGEFQGNIINSRFFKKKEMQLVVRSFEFKTIF